MLAHFGEKAVKEANGQAVHAWQKPGGTPAEVVSLRGQRGAGQQGRRQGGTGADREEAVRCRGLARDARGIPEYSLHGGRSRTRHHCRHSEFGRRRIMSATAKLFMHGRSQAVRLPKEFRFEGTEVRVSKVGDKVILEPLKKEPFDAEAWFARLDELGGRDFLPHGPPP